MRLCRPVAAILMLDNYEDLMAHCEDTQRGAVLAQIDENCIWANAGQYLLENGPEPLPAPV